MPHFSYFVILVLLGATILIYFRGLHNSRSSASPEPPISISPSSSTSHTKLITKRDESIKNNTSDRKSAKQFHAHSLIQKYILAGNLVLNASDNVYDGLFYGGNLYPTHQYEQHQTISSRCSEHALRAPVFPAISSRVMNHSKQWRRDLNQCARGNYIAIVTVVNNQAHRIVEWVVHNLLLGVDFIQVCDDCSVDNLREVLQPFIESHHVQVEGIDVWNSENSRQFQSQCYSWFWSQNVSSRFAYIANYDVDEFIVPTKEKCIVPAIQRFERNYPGATSL